MEVYNVVAGVVAIVIIVAFSVLKRQTEARIWRKRQRDASSERMQRQIAKGKLRLK